MPPTSQPSTNNDMKTTDNFLSDQIFQDFTLFVSMTYLSHMKDWLKELEALLISRLAHSL